MIARRHLLLGALASPLVAATAAQAESWLDLRAASGARIANHRVPAEIATQIDDLPGAIIAGNPQGDVTLAEFYDHNCSFCRRAAADVAALAESDANLRVVLVVIPQLSVGSVQAAKVELAVQLIAGDARAFEFHRRVFATRGEIDGPKALGVVAAMGLDRARIEEAADNPALSDILRGHVRLANALNLGATPAYVMQNVAMLGHPGRAPLADMIASVRRCDRLTC
jgi:protein-disulfide isomerase